MLHLLLLGCKEPVTEVIEAEDGALTVTLVNPTSCSSCDPFDGLQSLRVDVLRGGVSVVSESYTWPSEAMSLPPMDGFGVVQVQLRGIADGQVASFGQTPPVALAPGLTLQVPLTFLPVNRALPLTQPMLQGRRRHGSFALRDGRVLLFGGLGPAGQPTRSAELYEPATGFFVEAPFELPAAVADPTTVEVATGERFVLGGVAELQDTVEIASTEVVEIDEEAGVAATIEPFETARLGHCSVGISDTQIITFGGHDAPTPRGEFLRYDHDADAWKMSLVMLEDFDDRLVSGCGLLADGRTFVQGTAAESTGVWAYTRDSAGAVDPVAAFVPTPPDDPGAAAAFVVGPAIVPLADGDAWVGGGVDPRTGQAATVARELRAASVRFDPADAQPEARVWGVLRRLDDAGTVVWGCGWRNLSRSLPASTLQVFNVETGAVAAPIELEERAGCDLAVLPDGAVLVTGGGQGPGAEIVVPYVD